MKKQEFADICSEIDNLAWRDESKLELAFELGKIGAVDEAFETYDSITLYLAIASAIIFGGTMLSDGGFLSAESFIVTLALFAFYIFLRDADKRRMLRRLELQDQLDRLRQSTTNQ